LFPKENFLQAQLLLMYLRTNNHLKEIMKKILALLAASIVFASNSASATPFGFADDAGMFITQGYNGFNYDGGWGTMSWVNDTVLPIDSSYGIDPAALGAAWSNGGTNLTLTSSTPGQTFDIGSVDLNVGGTEEVTIQGLFNGDVVNSWTGTIVNQADYTTVVLNWTNIDELQFSRGANMFITNIDTDLTSVPEPASAALLGLGIAGMALMRRRKAD
jgi:hypothetical protein